MPFRARFDCLWCGRPAEARGPDDLEGWAQLCPACLGRAGENGFLRQRLRAALAERGQAAAAGVELAAYHEARAGEDDDWYLRRGRYGRSPLATLAWQRELDEATLWLDGLPLGGRVVELAAGSGWWSPLLAQKGELWCYEAAPALLDRARERLLTHGLRAHLHVRDAWAEPEPPPAGALFAGLWLSHVPRARLAEFLALARRWLAPGGVLAFIEALPDPAASAADDAWDPATETALRRLADGRTFRLPEVHYAPAELAAALRRAGFAAAEVRSTARFFILGRADA